MDWKAHLEIYKTLDRCNQARLLYEQVIKWQDPQVIQQVRSLSRDPNIRNKPKLAVIQGDKDKSTS